MKSVFKEMSVSLFSILLAFIAGGAIIQASGLQPLLAYRSLFIGSFGSLSAVSQTLFRSIPLIFTGLSVAFAYKCGLFNIGGEGQFLLGGLFAASAGFLIHAPLFVHLPLCLLLGFAGGAVCGALPGWLKARFGIHEVINTIMLNWICLNFVRYAVNGPFKDPSGLGTPRALPTSIPPLLFSPRLIPGGRLHAGFLIAAFVVFLAAFYLNRTVSGYNLRAVGYSPLASEYGGISVAKNMILAMTIAGALAGLAGAFYYLGDLGRIPSTLDFPGYGFEGIAVALVGKTNPYGVFLAAILFGALEAGGIMMQLQANVPKDLISIIQALVIVFVAAPVFVETAMDWLKRKKDPEGLELPS